MGFGYIADPDGDTRDGPRKVDQDGLTNSDRQLIRGILIAAGRLRRRRCGLGLQARPGAEWEEQCTETCDGDFGLRSHCFASGEVNFS
jgi:hypothetical protein